MSGKLGKWLPSVAIVNADGSLDTLLIGSVASEAAAVYAPGVEIPDPLTFDDVLRVRKMIEELP